MSGQVPGFYQPVGLSVQSQTWVSKGYFRKGSLGTPVDPGGGDGVVGGLQGCLVGGQLPGITGRPLIQSFAEI